MGQFADRLVEDLQLRGLSANTQRLYVTCMRRFVQFCKRPPDRLTLEDVRQYQLHLLRRCKVATSTFNVHAAAIRFFYRVTLRRPWAFDNRITFQKSRPRLPQVLSPQKVRALIDAIPNLKHRALVMTCYSAGLRATEVVRLKVCDIDSQRGLIRINQGKGRKDRLVMLSPRLLEILREYWQASRPAPWLFPGQRPGHPLDRSTFNRILHAARKAAGLSERLHPHVLRHSFASHLLEQGVNIGIIQRLLGHRSLRSTSRYIHVAADFLQRTHSPLDRLPDTAPSSPATP